MFSSLLHSFGLDISDLSAKAVCVKSNFRNERVIYAWAQGDVPAGVITDGDIVDKEKARDALMAILARMRPASLTPYVTASLPESKTFIKVIEIPSEGDALASILETLPNHIPIPLDELIIDWHAIHSFDDRLMVIVGAVPKTIAESYTDLLYACGLRVTAFEIEAQAIARAVSSHTGENPPSAAPMAFLANVMHFIPHKKNLQKELPHDKEMPARLIVDMGATRSSLMMLDWSTVQFTSSVALSGVGATAEIAERLKLTIEEAERAKRICGLDPKKCKGVVSGVLEGLLNKLAVEIERALDFYQTHFKRGHPVGEIVLTGGGANLAHAESILARQLPLPVVIGNPMRHIPALGSRDDFPKKDALAFTTALGLALRDELISS